MSPDPKIAIDSPGNPAWGRIPEINTAPCEAVTASFREDGRDLLVIADLAALVDVAPPRFETPGKFRSALNHTGLVSKSARQATSVTSSEKRKPTDIRTMALELGVNSLMIDVPIPLRLV